MSNDKLRVQLIAAATEIRQLAELTDRRFVFAESCTSGLAAASVGSQPGISQFFCGSHVTYRNESKSHWLDVKQHDLNTVGPVSSAVSKQMAEGALSRTPEAQLAVSVTGHLGPDSPDGLDGVVFLGVAIRLPDRMAVVSHRIVLPSASRADRQQLATLEILCTLRRVLQLIRATEAVCLESESYAVIGDTQVETLLSGSFNPVHIGHFEMAEYVQKALSKKVHFEISVENVDKSDLNQAECLERALSICLMYDIVLTRAKTFRQKARIFGKSCFLVGTDTIGRIAESRYYRDQNDRDEALQELLELEVCFLVFGRTMDESFSTSSEDQLHYTRLEDMDLPVSLLQICTSVDEQQFRQDVSSRDLR